MIAVADENTMPGMVQAACRGRVQQSYRARKARLAIAARKLVSSRYRGRLDSPLYGREGDVGRAPPYLPDGLNICFTSVHV